jgi:hypothetical protein
LPCATPCNCQEEERTSLLQQFVERGLLRTTRASNGEPYYWLTTQLTRS